MTKQINLKGQLLIAQPRSVSKFFAGSVVLVAKHDHTGAWGLIVNRALDRPDLTLESIMYASGIDSHFGCNDALYIGGPLETAKISVIHSLDWQGLSTIKVNDRIGITTDVSILTALAGYRGPKYFRTMSGMCGWGAGQLEGEQSGAIPWLPGHRWLTAPATIESVFEGEGDDQWKSAIDHSVKEKIDQCFKNITSPFQD